MTPSATALIDQATAATNHSLASLHHTAQRFNGTTGAATPGAIGKQMVTRLHNGLHSARIGFCPHLTATAPQPALWTPWASGLIRCAPCMTQAVRRTQGTAEDHKCDHCRRRTVTMHFVGLQLPAVVLSLPGRALALPPVQIDYSLCSTCKQLDQPGMARG
ncbi:hypothetical protein HTZ77_18585 [Nonomuraea sp. SMC257]|uniref:Uncharacterized protein n=1 Tax=Nonomuraea montanisoli TaxID=2741721 RepID=A0A7Y6M3N6_9ACTN|nr:hypothetical protein [Nonomuraea montanisoli]NUW33422.1 hypothetical protein [Nonomuraea montanisoli]